MYGFEIKEIINKPKLERYKVIIEGITDKGEYEGTIKHYDVDTFEGKVYIQLIDLIKEFETDNEVYLNTNDYPDLLIPTDSYSDTISYISDVKVSYINVNGIERRVKLLIGDDDFE